MAYKFKKSDIIKAVKGSGGYMINVAKKLSVDWMTAKKFVDKYNLHSLIEAENERLNDITEMKLLQNIEKGDTTAIIFRLKTRAKDRGYNQDTNVNVKIQPYNPNNITFEQRQELINDSIRLLTETTANSINNAIETDYILENEN